MDWLLPLVGGLGIGALIKSVFDHFMSRRAIVTDRLYQEKRETYLGLLNALHEAAVNPSDENSKTYALWQTRSQLFGSDQVAKYAQALVDTDGGPREARSAAFKSLIEAMKSDLKR
jgi:hypothetical protein